MGTVVLKPPVDFVHALLDRSAFRTVVQRSLDPAVEVANILLGRLGEPLRYELRPQSTSNLAERLII